MQSDNVTVQLTSRRKVPRPVGSEIQPTVDRELLEFEAIVGEAAAATPRTKSILSFGTRTNEWSGDGDKMYGQTSRS